MKKDKQNKIKDDLKVIIADENVKPQPESPKDFSICIYREVFEDLKQHAATNTTKELGGLLFGTMVSDSSSKKTLLIKGFVNAMFTEALKGSITFTHKSWNYMHQEHERLYPDMKIVGWYHTHPGTGIFMSSHDLFIQQNFFNLPWQTALVIDPVNQDDGIFCWDQGKIVRCEYSLVEDPGEEPAESKTQTGNVKRRRSLLMTAALTLMALVIAVGSVFFHNNSLTRNCVGTVEAQQQAGQGAEKRHVVKKGETLTAISMSYYGTSGHVAKIAASNNINTPDLIYPGQTIVIPK